MKQTHFALWAVLALLAVFALTACSQQAEASVPTETAAEPVAAPTEAPAPQSISLTDGSGATLELAGPAQRVISLAPSNTEILYYVGAGPQVVGRDSVSDYPSEALAVTDIGGGFGSELAMETIVSLQPDLVLAADITPPEQVKALTDLGLTVFTLPNPLTLEDMYANLMTVAKLTGHEAETETLVAGLQARVAAIDAAVAGATGKPLVFYELDSTDPNAPYTAGPGTFVDTLIARSGGENLGAKLDGAWAQMSIEALLTEDPDIIVLGDSAYGVTPEALAAREGWGTLTAVQNGAVYPFDDNTVSRPGPRLVDGLEAMARTLHPELFN